MGSGSTTTPALCDAHCQIYEDYLYCMTGTISWAQCLSGGYEAPPTYGYPYYSPSPETTWFAEPTKHSKDYTSVVVSAVAAGIAGTAILYCLTLLLYCYWMRMKREQLEKLAKAKDSSQMDLKGPSLRQPDEPETFLEIGREPGPPAIVPDASSSLVAPVRRQTRSVSFKDLATGNVDYSPKNPVAEGRSGPVYNGRLATGEEVTVIVLNSHHGSRELLNEVSVESGMNHQSLLPVFGSCDEGHTQKRILNSEHMSEGSLDRQLHGTGASDSQPLDWRTRLEIAVNGARGIEYLHEHCEQGIIHGNINSSNILVGHQFCAKLAILESPASSPETPGAHTTKTYALKFLDPEQSTTARDKLTLKTDVFAFGVVLLEIICSRPPIEEQWNIVEWARSIMSAGKEQVEAMVDPALEKAYNIDSVWKVVELAMACVEPLGSNRPDMKHVVHSLMEAIQLQDAGVQPGPSMLLPRDDSCVISVPSESRPGQPQAGGSPDQPSNNN